MRCYGFLLFLADNFLTLFIFFPLAIFHWRGTWDLQDVYFFPGNEEKSGWLSLGIGSCGTIFAQLLIQPYIYKTNLWESNIPYTMLSRAYLYINAWLVLCYWRGTWNLLDLYLTAGWKNSVIVLCVTQVISFVSMASRNNVGLPVSVALDTDPDILAPDTQLKQKHSKMCRFAGDVLFTQFIVVTCNVCIWRGIWNICDAFLFPSHHLESDLVSLAIGYSGLTLILAIQYPLSLVSVKLNNHKVAKVIYEDFVMLVVTWINLLLWRGGWDLCVGYVIPDKVIGGWITHWIGSVSLLLLQVFNTVALNGMEVDGGYPGGEGIFPTKYLRSLLPYDEKETGPYRVLLSVDDKFLDISDSDTDSLNFDLKTINGTKTSNGKSLPVPAKINPAFMDEISSSSEDEFDIESLKKKTDTANGNVNSASALNIVVNNPLFSPSINDEQARTQGRRKSLDIVSQRRKSVDLEAQIRKLADVEAQRRASLEYEAQRRKSLEAEVKKCNSVDFEAQKGGGKITTDDDSEAQYFLCDNEIGDQVICEADSGVIM